MPGQVMPLRVGELEVLVQTVPVAGSEPTSVGKAADAVLSGFDKAREVVVAIAGSTVGAVAELGSRAVRPDKVEVEFGLGFSVKGNVIVVGGQADATLKVKLTYDRPHPEV
jgi:hypothetical protein